jgi:hypothetical protein
MHAMFYNSTFHCVSGDDHSTQDISEANEGHHFWTQWKWKGVCEQQQQQQQQWTLWIQYF